MNSSKQALAMHLHKQGVGFLASYLRNLEDETETKLASQAAQIAELLEVLQCSIDGYTFSQLKEMYPKVIDLLAQVKG